MVYMDGAASITGGGGLHSHYLCKKAALKRGCAPMQLSNKLFQHATKNHPRPRVVICDDLTHTRASISAYLHAKKTLFDIDDSQKRTSSHLKGFKG